MVERSRDVGHALVLRSVQGGAVGKDVWSGMSAGADCDVELDGKAGRA